MVEAQKTPLVADPEDEAEQIAAYLEAHPDFFELRPALLESLSIPHASGTAVSLIERQVTRLKQRNHHLQKRLEVLIETAKENENRVLGMNRLARRLIEADSLPAVIDGLRDCLLADFDVTASMVILREPAVGDAQPAPVDGLRILGGDESGLPRALNNVFRTGCCECLPLTDELGDYLFPDAEETLGSVALVPLARQDAPGVLVLASADPGRFQPHVGTWFLEQLAFLVSGAVTGRLAVVRDGRG